MNSPQAVVAHNVLYLWVEPKRGTEQVTQLLTGATVSVLKTEGVWSYVEGDDGYRGWAETRWLVPAESAPKNAQLATVTSIFADLRKGPAPDSDLLVRLSMLSGVYTTPGDETVVLADGVTRGYLPAGALTPLPKVAAGEVAAYAAQRAADFFGTPYLWGGSSSYGLDCSGLCQFCYRLAGVILRRDADIQRNDERFVPAPVDALEPGDLVFFGKGPEKITHIGIYYKDNTFIHAAGGAGTILTPVGDDRYWPIFVDARRLDPARAFEPVARFESDQR